MVSTVHYSQEDFSSIPQLGVVYEELASAPSSPAAGRMYYDTTLGYPLVNVGTSGSPVWVPMGLVAGVIVDAMISSSAAIALSKLAVNPLARANHTGTQTASTISDLATVVQAYSLSAFAGPTGDLAIGSHKLTGLTDPTSAQDAATKAYVDAQVAAAAAGYDPKASVRVAAPGSITISGPGTAIDGVTLSTGDRVLLPNQSTPSQNGIYVFNGSSSAMTRTTDCNSSANYVTGSYVLAEAGTANGMTEWVVTTQGSITVGTTSVSWAKVGSGTAYTASTGIVLTGSAFSIDTTIVAQKVTGSVGSASAGGTVDFTHNLGVTLVNATFTDASTGQMVSVAWKCKNSTTITVGPVANALTSGALNVSVSG